MHGGCVTIRELLSFDQNKNLKDVKLILNAPIDILSIKMVNLKEICLFFYDVSMQKWKKFVKNNPNIKVLALINSPVCANILKLFLQGFPNLIELNCKNEIPLPNCFLDINCLKVIVKYGKNIKKMSLSLDGKLTDYKAFFSKNSIFFERVDCSFSFAVECFTCDCHAKNKVRA